MQKNKLTNVLHTSSSSKLRSEDQVQDLRQAKRKVEENISERLHGRREVVRYDSPTKQRLLDAEEKIIEEYKISSRSLTAEEALLKQKLEGRHKGYNASTADRLLVLEREKQKKLNKLRQQRMLENLSEMKSKPTITEYHLKGQRVPVHLRKGDTSDFDHEVERQRSKERRRGSVDEEEYTFTPNIGANPRNRSTEDLFDWHSQKMQRMATKRMDEFEQQNCTFKPTINRKSQELVVAAHSGEEQTRH